MMAGRRDKPGPLQALILLSLLILSRQTEGTDEGQNLHPPAQPGVRGQPECRVISSGSWPDAGRSLRGRWGNFPTCVSKTEQEQNQTQTPQEAADPRPPLEWQQILMLQEDAVVRRAASSLFQQHPAGSSLFALDQNQTATLVRGQRGPMSGSSGLVLVGHGARDASGDMRLSGYTSQELARIIQSASRLSASIQSTRLLGCQLGSDPAFIESLLRELQRAGVQTELHLWSAAVQVTDRGQILTKDASQWRHRDSSKKVVAAIDRRGRLSRRQEGGGRGEPVSTTDANALQPPQKGTNRPSNKPTPKEDPWTFRGEWPKKEGPDTVVPKRFIDTEVSNQIDQNIIGDREKTKEALREVEGLAWAIFLSYPGETDKITVDHTNYKYVIGEKNGNDMNWFNTEDEMKKVLENCYDMNSALQTRRMIRHYGKDGDDGPTYMMVRNWIFRVEAEKLYVKPVGKRMAINPKNKVVDKVKKEIEDQNKEGKENYNNIKNLIRNEKNNLPYLMMTILTGDDPNKELSLGHCWYFAASVIAESSRNFRTFPVTLMVLDMADSKVTGAWNFLFDGHPMVAGGSWVDVNRRGFSGTAAPPPETAAAAAAREKLKVVMEKELKIFQKWKSMSKVETQAQLEARMAELLTKFSIDNTQFRTDFPVYMEKTAGVNR